MFYTNIESSVVGDFDRSEAVCHEPTTLIDPKELSAFVEVLRDISFHEGTLGRVDLKRILLPRGLNRVRYFEADSGLEMGACLHRDPCHQFTAEDIGDAFYKHPDYRDRIWLRTTARPVVVPGELDLEIVIGPEAAIV